MNDITNAFEDLIGQDHIKTRLNFYLEAHKATNLTPVLMFNGSKGMGKTEMAKKFAKNLKKPLLEINCATIKNNQQFFEQIFMPVIMDNEITILFDEAHNLPKELQQLFLIVFNIESARSKQVNWRESTFEFNFEKQTYIFATTELDKIFPPLKERFTVVDFKPYTEQQLGEIINKRLDWVEFADGVVQEIAETVRGNARDAVKRTKEIEMYCEARNSNKFTMEAWKELCGLVGINVHGLNNTEMEILAILKDRGDCTLGMLSAATGMSRTAIQRDVETYLLRKALIKIEGTRKITNAGIRVLAKV
jgi:Holliday junction resolvasome RuvABC ATP-dependent DNA helicase subunit